MASSSCSHLVKVSTSCFLGMLKCWNMMENKLIFYIWKLLECHWALYHWIILWHLYILLTSCNWNLKIVFLLINNWRSLGRLFRWGHHSHIFINIITNIVPFIFIRVLKIIVPIYTVVNHCRLIKLRQILRRQRHLINTLHLRNHIYMIHLRINLIVCHLRLDWNLKVKHWLIIHTLTIVLNKLIAKINSNR